MLVDRLEKKINEGLKTLLDVEAESRVGRPSVVGNGELSCNTPMQVFGKIKNEGKSVNFNTARDLAFEIKEQIEGDDQIMKSVEKIEVAGPGFLNFYLKDDYLTHELLGESLDFDRGNGKKVLVEYSSPNIAKRFGVGHMRSTIVGQAILNTFKTLGFDTVGDNHLGDWGTQFGAIIAAVEHEGVDIEKMNVADLESMYVRYNRLIEENEYYKTMASDAFKRLEEGETEALHIWKVAKETSLKEFDEIYQRMNVRIDFAYGEAFYEQIMKDIVIPQVKEKLAKESEGALIVEFEKMPPAMLLKSNGTTTYFTRDLATIYFRQNTPEMKSDLYIYEVGAEQELHFRQVFETAVMMGWAKPGQLVHVSHGLMRLPEGKISTRKGRNVKLLDLLDGSVAIASEKIKSDISEEESKRISELVGIGAVKFNELKHSPRTDYVFKMEEAMSLEGDSGPYVMYAVVRARAILQKAEGVEINIPADVVLNEEEKKILTHMIYYPSILNTIANAYTPNLMCAYLLELASLYNQFYTNNQVLKAEEGKVAVRVAITKKFVDIAVQGLAVLGITLPERM